MAIIRTAWSSKSQGVAATYVGRKGEIFWDNDSAELRYSDGVTIGGIPIVASGGGGGSGVTIQITGYVDNAGLLVDPWTGAVGDTILARDTGNLYIWDGSNWVDLGVVLGPRGYDGSHGYVGSMGFQGYSGSFGLQGYTGSFGFQGYTGSTGAGYVGSTGFGYAGSRGAAGTIGPIGYTGSGGSGGGGGGSLSSITDLITTVTNVVSLRFDSATGLIVTDLGSGIARVSINSSLLNPDSFKSISVTGQNTITASGADTIRFVAGAGMVITTDDTAAPKTVTFSSSGGTGGSNSQPLKTFNVLNDFSAPLMGSAIFVPNATDTIRSVRLTNATRVGSDLMVGLYRNNDLLNFFTLPAGYYTYSYDSLAYTINNNDYLTVNVVSGSGKNFSLALFNI